MVKTPAVQFTQDTVFATDGCARVAQHWNASIAMIMITDAETNRLPALISDSINAGLSVSQILM